MGNRECVQAFGLERRFAAYGGGEGVGGEFGAGGNGGGDGEALGGGCGLSPGGNSGGCGRLGGGGGYGDSRHGSCFVVPSAMTSDQSPVFPCGVAGVPSAWNV